MSKRSRANPSGTHDSAWESAPEDTRGPVVGADGEGPSGRGHLLLTSPSDASARRLEDLMP